MRGGKGDRRTERERERERDGLLCARSIDYIPIFYIDG